MEPRTIPSVRVPPFLVAFLAVAGGASAQDGSLEECCEAPYNFGFSARSIESDTPFEGIAGAGLGDCDAAGGTISAALVGGTTPVFVHIVTTGDSGVVAWQLSVEVTGDIDVAGGTVAGMVAGNLGCGGGVGLVDPDLNGGRHGVVAYCILPGPPFVGLPGGTSSVLRLDLVPRGGPGTFPAAGGLRFTDGLRGPFVPFENLVVTPQGNSAWPCNLDTAEVTVVLEGEIEAVIDASPQSGPEPLEVAFSGSGSLTPEGTTITRYAWDFGDGTTGEGEHVTHTYEDRGTYTVSLTIENDHSHTASASEEVTVTFGCGDPSPFVSADVGGPGVEGCARQDGDCLLVFGGGREIGGRADQFQFTYAELTGDGAVTARLESFLLDGSSARMGIMLRATGAADAAFAFMRVTPRSTGGVTAALSYRASSGQTAATRLGTLLDLPLWLRIERAGSGFIGSYSTDGESFVESARAELVSPPETMLAGLAITSRDAVNRGLGSEATFCDVAVLPVARPLLMRRGDCTGDGSIDLDDAVRGFRFCFRGQAVPCAAACDADGDGSPCTGVTDGVRILMLLFRGGVPLPAPFPDCGPATEGDGTIGCEESNCNA